MSTTAIGVFLLLAAVVCNVALAQKPVSGTLTIGNDKFEIKYAAATVAPDVFDKSKKVVRIVLTDKPVAEDTIDDEGLIMDLKSQGVHGLKIDIAQDKSNFAALFISNTIQGSFSRSGTFDGKQLTVFTNTRAEGVLQAEPEQHGDTTVAYRIQFATAITPPAAAPTAADAAAAAGKESTKAYLALMEAIRTGNKQKILEMSPPEKRAMIDTPEFPQILQLVQAMQPHDLRILKATENGDKATLLARGTLEGRSQRGKIFLSRQNGKWILENESWSNE
jgi:hypothetical protein